MSLLTYFSFLGSSVEKRRICCFTQESKKITNSFIKTQVDLLQTLTCTWSCWSCLLPNSPSTAGIHSHRTCAVSVEPTWLDWPWVWHLQRDKIKRLAARSRCEIVPDRRCQPCLVHHANAPQTVQPDIHKARVVHTDRQPGIDRDLSKIAVTWVAASSILLHNTKWAANVVSDAAAFVWTRTQTLCVYLWCSLASSQLKSIPRTLTSASDVSDNEV